MPTAILMDITPPRDVNGLICEMYNITLGIFMNNCAHCGQSIEEGPKTEERVPVGMEGGRALSITFIEPLESHDKITARQRSHAGGKPSLELTSGDDLHRKSGVWMKLERVIDRVKDWYREVIINPKTGDIVHKCEEPLSRHQGHGSASKKQK
jgi:hypothetical protein